MPKRGRAYVRFDEGDQPQVKLESMGRYNLQLLVGSKGNVSAVASDLMASASTSTLHDRFVIWIHDAHSEEELFRVLLQEPIALFRFKLATLLQRDARGQLSVSLYSVCFYCDHGSPRLVFLGTYEEGDQAIRLPLFRDYAKDLHDVSFKFPHLEIYDMQQ